MTEKVNSTHGIKKNKKLISKISNFNDNFGSRPKNGLWNLRWFDMRLVLNGMIKLLDSIKEEDFDEGETQKKALIDSLAEKNKHYKKR